MGEIDNMTLYELLQYADKELDIIIQQVSRAKALEDKMLLEAKKTYPKGVHTIQEYSEYFKDDEEKLFGYSIAYNYIREQVIIVGCNVNCVPFSHEPFFVNLESILKFREENLDELRWYFKEYKKL